MSEIVRKNYAAYAIGLPNDMTCWHFPKGSEIMPQEAMHTAMLTARARAGDIYVFLELEKAALEAPEKHKRVIAGRIAALKRKLHTSENEEVRGC